jgi:hypothetical protein
MLAYALYSIYRVREGGTDMASRRQPPSRAPRAKSTDAASKRISRGGSAASVPRRNVFFGDPRITGHRRKG